MMYNNLQKGIDAIIGSLGTEKTITLLDRIARNLHLTKASDNKHIELVAAFIIAESKTVFDVTQCHITRRESNYILSRSASYHLLRKYTPLSYHNIGTRYGQSKRATIYHHDKAAQKLSLPKLHPLFCNKYKYLEQRLLDFLTQIQ